MAILTAGSTELFLDTRVFEPAIRGWNRLEGRPRAAEFDRSLRAEVRDPLWFLTRQWQFGEFQGEDAGSPIDARLAYATTKLVHYLPRSGDRLDFPQNRRSRRSSSASRRRPTSRPIARSCAPCGSRSMPKACRLRRAKS